MTVEEFVRLLGKVKRSGGGWVAKCPSHDDRHESLSVGVGTDGRVLVHCFAGCKAQQIAEALGLRPGDLFPAPPPSDEIVYDYTDENGEVLMQVVRRPGKKFVQRRPDGRGGWDYKLGDVRRVPYRLHDVANADPAAPVFVPEGEKDCDNLAARGFIATTNMGGAEAWGKVAAEARKALAGRTVIVLPDNDDPGRKHAQDVVTSLRDVATVRVLSLPGLPPKGDVSDWLCAGGTADALMGMARRAVTATDDEQRMRFTSAADRLKGEAVRRAGIVARELSFNVSFLDDVFGGILPNDLVLLGAPTGAGKTQLASIIAQTNAKQGRRVHYFALEAEDDEIERRLKYRAIASRYFSADKTRLASSHVSYRDWYRRKLDTELAEYEADADAEIASDYRTLFTAYRGCSFTGHDIARMFAEIQSGTDLVVLDHLHYVDCEQGEEENAGYKRVVKMIRDWSLMAGVPVILIAQLRKKNPMQKSIVSDLDAFHGTSDIVKMATKVILLDRPKDEAPTENGAVWGTYMTGAKFRMDGSVVNYVAAINYDVRQAGYSRQYKLGRLTSDGFRGVTPNERPYWACNAVIDDPNGTPGVHERTTPEGAEPD